MFYIFFIWTLVVFLDPNCCLVADVALGSNVRYCLLKVLSCKYCYIIVVTTEGTWNTFKMWGHTSSGGTFSIKKGYYISCNGASYTQLCEK